MPKTKEKKPERILILCVDRDDDIGTKAGIKTPVLGSKENINAATSLALQDPEEADANAMFEAVRVYNHLKEGAKEGEEYQIATIAGSELGSVGADRQLVSELTEVLEEFPATDVILVTDGYTDGAVLPLIESRVPVTSVRRIVVKHSSSIEETAAVFSRYLKMLVENPRYSRILLGLPGILLIVLVALWLMKFELIYIGVSFVLVLGMVLLVKGFSLDKAAAGFYKWVREYSPPPYPVQIAGFSAVAGVLLILVGFYLGGTAVANAIPKIEPPPTNFGEWLPYLPTLLGQFIYGAIALIVIGICVLLSGRAIRWFFERDLRLWRTIVIVVIIGLLWPIFDQASRIIINPAFPSTGLVISIIAGLPLIVVAVLVSFLLRRRYASFFRKRGKEIEEFKEG
jgi:putative membrane protein